MGSFSPDPLSPYLFIMVADVLSNMVIEFAQVIEIEGIKLARNCPILTHCFFADDALFFLKANTRNSSVFRKMLDWYCAASGQLINLDKSCTFFLPMSLRMLRRIFVSALGYLMPLVLGSIWGCL